MSVFNSVFNSVLNSFFNSDAAPISRTSILLRLPLDVLYVLNEKHLPLRDGLSLMQTCESLFQVGKEQVLKTITLKGAIEGAEGFDALSDFHSVWVNKTDGSAFPPERSAYILMTGVNTQGSKLQSRG